MKTCTRCGTVKSLDDFAKNMRRADGLQCWCRACKSETNKEWNQRNLEHKSAYSKQWRLSNLEKRRADAKLWAQSNPERRDEIHRSWRDRNRKHLAERTNEWRRANPHLAAAQRARYDAAKLSATCPFDLDLFSLVEREAYDLSARRTLCTGIAWNVDHIVPLRSKIVCGLHNEYNLAVIPASTNARKSNRYWPEMP